MIVFPDEKNCEGCKWCGTYKRKKVDPEGLPDMTVYTCKRKKTETLTFKNPAECVCDKHQQRIDPVEEWNEAIKGKPIAEWPPMPKEINLIKYDNGIILTTAETIEEYMNLKREVSKCSTT